MIFKISHSVLVKLKLLKHGLWPFHRQVDGCRAAASLARQLSDESEAAVQGVICLSFPLHPPGQTHAHRQRSEDLRMLPEYMRVLFVSGTEDNMCDRVREKAILDWPNFIFIFTYPQHMFLRSHTLCIFILTYVSFILHILILIPMVCFLGLRKLHGKPFLIHFS